MLSGALHWACGCCVQLLTWDLLGKMCSGSASCSAPCSSGCRCASGSVICSACRDPCRQCGEEHCEAATTQPMLAWGGMCVTPSTQAVRLLVLFDHIQRYRIRPHLHEKAVLHSKGTKCWYSNSCLGF